MEFIFDLALEVVAGLLEVSFKGISKKEFEVSIISETKDRESYITGLIATTLSLSYVDDKLVDKHEKKIIKDLLNTYRRDLTKKTVKNIKYLRKHIIDLDKLKLLYTRLNIDNYTIIKIVNDLDWILQKQEKENKIQRDYLNQIRNIYQDD